MSSVIFIVLAFFCLIKSGFEALFHKNIMFEHNFDKRKTIKICYRTIYFAQNIFFSVSRPKRAALNISFYMKKKGKALKITGL